MTPWQERTNGPGIHSIPAIHTTQRHIITVWWPRNQSLREAWNYSIGKTAPRYPVPATELTSAYAATFDRVSPLVKLMLLERFR